MRSTPGSAAKWSEAARALETGGWLVIVDETYASNSAQARQPDCRFPLRPGFEELMWGAQQTEKS